MFTMLVASKMNGGRDRLHELSGIPPLSFTAKGKPLTAWSITGNTVQNGTPTPENPVEVQSVGDRTGNLFDGLLIGGLFTSADFNTSGNKDVYKSIKVFLPAGTYTFSFDKNVNIVRLIIDGNYSQPVYTDASSYTITSTTNGYVGISFRDTTSSSTVWDVTTPIMLNEGSTSLPYEPYGYKIPVVTRGKNLAGNYTVSSGYYYDDSGTPTASDARFIRLTINVEPNTIYTISSNLKFYSIWEFNNNTKISRRVGGNSNKYTIKTTKECNSLRISMSNTSGEADTSAFEWIQLEKGSTATPYEPYQEPITTPIYLPTPLYSGEVIRSDGTITRSDGTTETFTAPQIPTINGTTVIDVDTAVKPESMTIKYRG